MNSTLEAAHKFLKAGFRPIPINREKRPMVSWKEYMERPPTSDEMNGWPWNGHLALVVDQFEVLDFDLKNTKEKNIFDNWRMAVSHVHTGILDSCLIVKTKNGGFHVIYRTDEIAGNTKLAETETGETVIETRGHGGIVATVPSPGYSTISGSWRNLPKIDSLTRALFLETAKAFDKKTTDPIISGSDTINQNIVNSDDNLFHKFKASYTAEDLLRKYGWKFLHQKGDCSKWNRPGGAGRDESASLKNGVLFVHSTSTPLPHGKNLDAFDIFCWSEHGGDKSAAARHARQLLGITAPIKYPSSTHQAKPVDPPKEDDLYFFSLKDDIVELVPGIVVMREGKEFPLVPLEGLLTISGEAGLGKTAIARALAASMLSGRTKAGLKARLDKKILWIDTEQPKPVFQRTMRNICHQAGTDDSNLIAWWGTEHDARDRLAVVNMLVEKHKEEIGLVVIDGYRDIVVDINDNTEATSLIQHVMKWRSITGAIICGIIHVNEGSMKLRGTIGTELTNKSDAIAIVRKGDDNLKIWFKKARSWTNPGEIVIHIDEYFIPYCPDDPGRDVEPNISNDLLTTRGDIDFVPF